MTRQAEEGTSRRAVDGASFVSSVAAGSKRGGSLSSRRRVVLVALALLPWVAALLLLYLFESRAVWRAEQPLRALASVTILAAGMSLSFLLHDWLRRRP